MSPVPPTLRPYQAEMLDRIALCWERGGVPLAVLPTGAGKTVVFARAVAKHGRPSVIIAHRKELLAQISLALTREDTPHNILAPTSTIRQIVRAQNEKIGSVRYNTGARVTVASVDSFRRAHDAWLEQISLWVIDEGHHPLRDNKWGRAIARMPRGALGLGVTATPCRADRCGLGARAEGFYTELVEGPNVRELTEMGFLCPYRLFAPITKDLDLSTVQTGQNGDYRPKQLRAAVRRSRIVGDVVQQYLAHAAGKRGVTFAVGVEAAEELAEAYRAAGVPAACVHAKTKPTERERAIAKLERGELLQLVNVDLFGEGFDLPAIDCVSMARPTKSYAVYAQQFGRALRPSPGKTHAVILDHAGNVHEHAGPPDIPRIWSLDSPMRREPSFANPYATCPQCSYVYLRTARQCPDCGYVPEPVDRSSPDAVAGDLTELDAAALDTLYAAVARVDRTTAEVRVDAQGRHVPEIGVRAEINRHRKTQAAQAQLRDVIAWWAGVQKHAGLEDPASMRLFYRTFGVDVLSARALKAKDADALRARIEAQLPEEIRHRAQRA